LGHPYGIIDVQVDGERRRVLGWPLPADYLFMPLLVHHAIEGDTKAAEPTAEIACRAIRGCIDPQLMSVGEQLPHPRPRAVAKRFGIPPAPPPRHKLFGRDSKTANQRIVNVKRDPHQHTSNGLIVGKAHQPSRQERQYTPKHRNASPVWYSELILFMASMGR